jgi:hypothetical protein
MQSFFNNPFGNQLLTVLHQASHRSSKVPRILRLHVPEFVIGFHRDFF